MSGQNEIADLESGTVPAAQNTHNHNLLIVSDLHLGEGWEADGKLNRNEDFLYDKEFAHFLVYHQQKREQSQGSGNLPWRLILNGDVVDFLQVTEVPAATDVELIAEVGEFLGQPTIATLEKALDELTAVSQPSPFDPIKQKRLEVEVKLFLSYKKKSSANSTASPYKLPYNSRRWGLGSSPEENVWRLHRIFQGHPIFFQGLAWFLAMGNEIVIQTGNHDIEIFWREVRAAFRDIILLAHGQLAANDWRLLLTSLGYAHYAQSQQIITDNSQFSNVVAAKLAFTHWIYYEPGVAYIEHGCQYETANSWPTYLNPKYVPIKSPGEGEGEGEQSNLLWPWGSLIVRYIFNRIEQVHPFVDQIKPITAYLTWAFSRDLLRSIWLLLVSIPGLLRVGHQILHRGVMEGWFGNTLSITGVFTMTLRGMLMWLAWLRQPNINAPLLPSERWYQVRKGDKGRQGLLAERIVHMYESPVQIEEQVLNEEPEGNDFIKTTSPLRQLLELFIWLGTVTAVFLVARWVVGWEILAKPLVCGETAVFCRLLPDVMTRSVLGISVGYAAKLINVAMLVLTLCIIYTSAKARAFLDGDEPGRILTKKTITPIVVFIAVFFLSLGAKVYYTFSTFSTSSRPVVIDWLIFGSLLSLILVIINPKGKWERFTSLFKRLFILVSILGLYFGAIWLISTFATSEQTVESITLWAAGWGLLTLWLLGKLGFFSGQTITLMLASTVGGAILGIFSLALAILYQQAPLEPPLSSIALWGVGWGFLGLWLLESKDNPFRERTEIQGWLKDYLGDSWLWLAATFNSSFTFLVEFGLLLLFSSAIAITFKVAPPLFLGNLLDDSGALFRALFTAVLLIIIGGFFRWLLSIVQIENFPDRVKIWYQTHTWQLDILLGLGVFGLISGTFWFLFGKSMYLDPVINSSIVVVSLALNHFSKKRLNEREQTSLFRLSINGSWTFVITMLLLLWAGQIMIQTMGGVTTRLVTSPKWPWCLGTLFIVFWLLLSKEDGKEARARFRVVNTVSWLIGLMSLVFLLIILFGELAGKPLDLLTLLGEVSQQLSKLGTQLLERTKELLDIQETLQPQVNEVDPEITKNLAGLTIVTLALAGTLGKKFLQKTLALVAKKSTYPALDVEMQIERIIKVAERLQQSFIRRFARLATIALSIIFSAGLLIGVYLTWQFISSGESPFGVVGVLVGIISWVGRRFLPLIPSNINPDGGYLLEAATEIRSILHRGVDDGTSMQNVPYFLFGHDHHPAYEKLKRPISASNNEVKQWYVNTGAWVQSYSGDVRLRREDEDQSIFVEIIVDDVLAGKSLPPTLRCWDSKLGMPVPLNRLISPFEESLPKRVIKAVLRLIGIDDVPYTELK